MAAPMEKNFTRCSLILLILLQITVSEATRSLQLVHILFRHGDRSPVVTFPTDNNTEASWPQGFGQLTHIGAEQHYQLGSYFRERYIKDLKLLNNTYKRNELVVTSTDMDRTLMSAYANLAGLYPLSKQDQLAPNITWQPIPVHTRPLITDNVLSTDVPCPRADNAFNLRLKSPEVVQKENDNREFYEFLSNMTGVPHENVSVVWAIYDTLFCESRHNKTLPPWIDKKFGSQTVFEKLKELESLEFDLKLGGPTEGKLRGGNLLGEVVEHIKSMTSGVSGPDSPKLYIYSAHDTTVAAFMSAMQVFNKIAPPYTASVMVELYKEKSGNYSVQVLYQNTTGKDEAFNLTLPGCTQFCPLEQFLNLTEVFIPKDWYSECKLEPSHNYHQRVIIAIGTACGVLFLVILVAVIIVCYRRRPAVPEGYFGIQQTA